MAKKSSPIVSGAGLIASIWTALDKAVRKRGGSDEDMHRLGKPEGESLIDQFADIIVGAKQVVGKAFLIVCDGSYTASELIKRGGYDWYNDWITDSLFSLEKHQPVARRIEFVEMDYDSNSEDVLREFERRGLKSPTAEDALYFGLQHKDEQRKGKIVFLHKSISDPNSDRRVLALHGDADCRHLSMFLFGRRWLRGCRFAGVRESR